MATEPSVSKLRIETNGNGNGARDEELADLSAVASSITELPITAPGLSTLARGDFASGRWVIAGDGQVMGEYAGEIECVGNLVVGKGAEVNATIRGNEVTIAGLVRGNVTVEGRLRIASSGRLEGDARVGSLVVQEGGVHHGIIRVFPEGIPDDDEPMTDSSAATEPAQATQTPVDRVKKFWGEFF